MFFFVIGGVTLRLVLLDQGFDGDRVIPDPYKREARLNGYHNPYGLGTYSNTSRSQDPIEKQIKPFQNDV